MSTHLSKMFDVGDRDLPVPTSGNWVIKGCMAKWLRFYVFYVFLKIQKHDFLRFWELAHGFLEHCLPWLNGSLKRFHRMNFDTFEAVFVLYQSMYLYVYYNTKLSCCCDSRSYCVRRIYGMLENYQTGFDYKFTNGWYAGSNWPLRVYERTQSPNSIPHSIHSSVTEQSSRSQWITERNTTSACLIVCLKKFFDSFFSMRFVAKRYMYRYSKSA